MLAMLELLVRYHHVDNLTGLASKTAERAGEESENPEIEEAVAGRTRQRIGRSRAIARARRRRRAQRLYRLDDIFQPGRQAGARRRVEASAR